MDYSEKDKELLENLEKLIEGRESEFSESIDDGTDSELEVARKLMAMGENPSKEFEETLKAQIVERLGNIETQQAQEDPELVYWGVPRRKKWQGTLAALIMVIIIAIILVIVLNLNS